MSNRGQTGIPIMETIFADNLFLIFRLVDICEIDSLRLGIGIDHIFAMQNILFF